MRSPSVDHGGDLAAASAQFPYAPLPWLDLSTGINPFAYPIGEVSTEAWTRLPEAGAVAALEAAAASAYGALAQEVVAAPGTQALIQALPRWLPARSVAILGVTYGEHERVWRESGAQAWIVDDIAGLADADVGVIVNPNNPDGRLVPVDALIEIAAVLARNGGMLVVDEAFVDVLPGYPSLAQRLPETGAVVLRSFGKTYGLAGLRLGFAIGPPDFAAGLRRRLGPWAVNGPAAEIGARALADRDWLARTRKRLQSDAARLDELLTRAGLKIIGGTPLFRLAERADAARVFRRLGKAGILVRSFPAKPNWLRFGIPGRPEDWARLEGALMAVRYSRADGLNRKAPR
jgi:cobalamin biosynthetic protein CobC